MKTMQTMQTSQLTTRSSGPLRGRVRVPGDKSISHRALLLGALAEGTSQVSGFLFDRIFQYVNLDTGEG